MRSSVALGDVDDAEPIKTDEQIAPVAVVRVRIRARTSTRRRLGHSRLSAFWLLGRSRSWIQVLARPPITAKTAVASTMWITGTKSVTS